MKEVEKEYKSRKSIRSKVYKVHGLSTFLVYELSCPLLYK